MDFGEPYPHVIEAFAVVGTQDGCLPVSVDGVSTLQSQLRYRATVLEHYPHQFGQSLLYREFPRFCFPDGLRVYNCADSEPYFFPFVLTDEQGRRLRCASIVYPSPIDSSTKFGLYRRDTAEECLPKPAWKPSPPETETKKQSKPERSRSISMNAIWSSDRKQPQEVRRSKSLDVLTQAPDAGQDCISGWYAARALCIISRKPIFGFMKRCLKCMYECVRVGAYVSLENFVRKLVGSVPMLAAGRRPIRWVLHIGDDPVLPSTLQLDLPSHQELPLLDFPIRHIFQCLDLDNVIQLLFLVLLERRVVVTSRRNALITYVLESVDALLHPFPYIHTYIPLLPYSIMECIEAPTPYMMGANVTHLREATEVDMNGVVYVDLDHNNLRIPKSEALPRLPRACVQSLKTSVWLHLHPELEFIQSLQSPTELDWEQHEHQIRLSFATFFCTLYSMYFGWFNEQQSDLEELLQAHPRHVRSFLKSLYATQAFQLLRNYLNRAHMSADRLAEELHTQQLSPRPAHVEMRMRLDRRGSELCIGEKERPSSSVLMLAARTMCEHNNQYLDALGLIQAAWKLDNDCISNEQALALIQELLSNMSESELEEAAKLNEDGSPVLRDAIHTEYARFKKPSPRPSLLLPPVSPRGKLKELNTAALGCMTESDFVKLCIVNELTHTERLAQKLFKVLMRHTRHRKLRPEKFQKLVSAVISIHNRPSVRDSEILLYSADAWTPKHEKTRLLLTDTNIVVQFRDSVTYYCITSITSVIKYDHKTLLPPGYPCIKITMGGASRATIFLFVNRGDRDVFFLYLNAFHTLEMGSDVFCAVLLTEAIRVSGRTTHCLLTD